MGFNFSRGGGAGGNGGGIRRRPLMTHGEIDLTPAYGIPVSPITSPQFILNNGVDLENSPGSAFQTFSMAGSTTTQSLTFSFNSSYWIDFLLFIPNVGASISSMTMAVEGETIRPRYAYVFGDNIQQFDVYGYGISGSFRLSATTYGFMDLQVAPILPYTIISTGGLAIWPPALSGQSVLRDI